MTRRRRPEMERFMTPRVTAIAASVPGWWAVYGDDFRAAGVLLGKTIPPAASHVCRAAGAHAVVAGG